MVELRRGEKARSLGALARRGFNYSLAVVGPAGAAGAQFLLSLTMLHSLDAAAFGAYSFLLLLSQFSWGIWSALFCAPLPVIAATSTESERNRNLSCLFSANAFGVVLAIFVFFLIGASLSVESRVSLLFALYAGAALLRWFARQYAYLNGNASRTALSDAIYCSVLLVGVGFVHFQHWASLYAPFCVLLASASLSLFAFGGDFFTRQFMEFAPSKLPSYAEIWKKYSSWSVLGVITTEATANAHAYLVTSFFGPTAFAPLSASALLIRPLGVVMNALVDYERSQLAHAIPMRDAADVKRIVRFFRFTLVAVWVGTMVLAVALMNLAPNLIFPPRYSVRTLSICGAIWMAIAAVRLLRTPESALLQAAGMFRPLAMASVMSAGVSIGVVAALMTLGGPVESLIGVLIGEAAYAAWVHRQTYLWWRRIR